jgi:hypothetical protein
MILRRWYGGPRTLVLLIVASLVFTLIPSFPAYAGDVARVPPSGWTSAAAVQTNGGCAGSNPPNGPTALLDNDENTNYGCTQAASNPRTFAYVRWTKTGGGDAPFTVESFRFTMGICTSGWPSYSSCGGGTGLTHRTVKCENTSGTAADTVYDADISGQSKVTFDQVNLDTPCVISTAGDRDTLKAYFSTSAQSGDAVYWTYEAYDDPVAPTETDIEFYIYDLSMSHPPFARVIEWKWKKTYTGSWTVTDSDDTLLGSGSMPGNEFPGASESVTIQCSPICGEDTYTITINDTGDNFVAYYEIDGDADGLLIDGIRPPDILWLQSCYNSTLNECPSPLNGAAGKVVVQYEWSGDESLPVTFGKVAPSGPPDMTGTTFTSSAATEGTRAATWTVTEGGSWVAYIENSVGNYDYMVFSIAYSTPGTVIVVTPPPDDSADGEGCDPALDNLGYLGCVLGSIFSASGTLIRAFFNEVNARLMTRQPFAFILGSLGALTTQVERAQLAVSSTSTCEGVHFTMPTLPPVSYHAFGADKTSAPAYYVYNNNVPSPSPFAFSALRCEDLEPWGGTAFWQGLRTVMGPALVLGYFVQLTSRYRVKPVLSG